MPYSYEHTGHGVVLTDDATGEDVYIPDEAGDYFLDLIDGDYDGYCNQNWLEEIAPEYFT